MLGLWPKIKSYRTFLVKDKVKRELIPSTTTYCVSMDEE